ncbi:MAG TPA: hypothetical protein VL096_01640 [Pirellulaceae bacterium]|nr:hypothetical protein [Pirellulaceae bacterium]
MMMLRNVSVPFIPVEAGEMPRRIDMHLTDAEGQVLRGVREATGSQSNADAVRSLLRLVGAAAPAVPPEARV